MASRRHPLVVRLFGLCLPGIIYLTCGSLRAQIPAEPVPAEWQGLYSLLESDLLAFQSKVHQQWDGRKSPVVFSAELLMANGNRGEDLLAPGVMVTVKTSLDAMQRIGVNGVGLQIGYPLLLDSFPRHDEYLAFFRSVADEVRRRGLVLLVETSPVFAGTSFSKVEVDYTGLTRDLYFLTAREQAVLIAGEIQPDYLSVGTEPDTEQKLTGVSFSVGQYVAHIEATLAAIRSVSLRVKVGAGSGTWSGLSYFRPLAQQTQLDFIDLHIYPTRSLFTDYLQVALQAADLARLNGKGLVMGESWLYKATRPEVMQGNIATSEEIFCRDFFSFWAPLDALFLQTMIEVGHWKQFDIVSFFWSNYFFHSLQYDASTMSLSAVDLQKLNNPGVWLNMLAGALTPIGSAYAAEICPIRGDVNRDWRVDEDDAELILCIERGDCPAPLEDSPAFRAADVNGDGHIDAEDADRILNPGRARTRSGRSGSRSKPD